VAAQVHREVAAERLRLLGPDHPETLASRYEIGFSLSRTGRADEALRAIPRVAADRGVLLSSEQPQTHAPAEGALAGGGDAGVLVLRLVGAARTGEGVADLVAGGEGVGVVRAQEAQALGGDLAVHLGR
ncbi:hypothetical protein H4F94_00110, partial [Streptomyces sp. SP18CM02]|nr:hypothetical protein [Streptomyces sp. SP18CM02]